MAQSGAGPPRRRPGSPIASVARLRRQDHHPRRRSFQVIRVLPLGWDLDPALGPARAFLNDRDIEHLLDGKTLVQRAAEDELVIVLVQQFAGPADLADALAQRGAVVVVDRKSTS